MRYDAIKAAEAIMYDYPDICRNLIDRHRYLEAGKGPSESGPVQGGPQVSEQERILNVKSMDAELCMLQAVTERISDMLREATDEMREVLRRLFFARESIEAVSAEMNFSPQTIRAKRYRALRFMIEMGLIDLYPIIYRWRAERDEDRIEAVLAVGM